MLPSQFDAKKKDIGKKHLEKFRFSPRAQFSKRLRPKMGQLMVDTIELHSFVIFLNFTSVYT